MNDNLQFRVARANDLNAEERTALIQLCTAAYEENFDHLFSSLPNATHVLGRLDGEIVTHAAWVTRWLQPAGLPLLRTAYVEAVATVPEQQGRGFGTAVMQHLQAHIQDYDLGALAPSEIAFYARLGWELWQGPLAIRTTEGIEPTPPDEEVMILRLPHTPVLDLNVLLTAEWREGELW
ncbi:MAG TPA: GNAT family N-acetyltransferase [Blastocatellia bacterium]|nr:GNAT family N-acetyltransferase [Blastocatellia bacterium]